MALQERAIQDNERTLASIVSVRPNSWTREQCLSEVPVQDSGAKCLGPGVPIKRKLISANWGTRNSPPESSYASGAEHDRLARVRSQQEVVSLLSIELSRKLQGK